MHMGTHLFGLYAADHFTWVDLIELSQVGCVLLGILWFLIALVAQPLQVLLLRPLRHALQRGHQGLKKGHHSCPHSRQLLPW
jgi:hypothetical protein